MKVKKEAALIFGAVSLFLINASLVFAQSSGQNPTGDTSVTLCDPLGNNCKFGGETFVSIAGNIANFLVVDIAIPITVIMVLVGAFQIMTAGGDPEKFSSGRKTITYAAIGLAAAFISLGAAQLIQNFLGG